jgi:hypothetical protein
LGPESTDERTQSGLEHLDYFSIGAARRSLRAWRRSATKDGYEQREQYRAEQRFDSYEDFEPISLFSATLSRAV